MRWRKKVNDALTVRNQANKRHGFTLSLPQQHTADDLQREANSHAYIGCNLLLP